MKLKEVREISKSYSERVSDINQKLSMAGIAIIWAFGKPAEGQINMPLCLKIPLFIFILSLAFDLLQYVLISIGWRRFYSSKYSGVKSKNPEKRISSIEEEEVEQPWESNYLGWILFYLKLVLMVLAYIYLAIALFILK